MTTNPKSIYEERLRSAEWREKRTHIVHRDGHKCMNCSNSNIVQVSQWAHLNNYYYVNSLKTIMLCTEPDTNAKRRLEFFVESFDVPKGSILYYQEFETIKGRVAKVMLIGELLSIDGMNKLSWTFAKGLNVHHTYYQDGKLPWEYPDAALETYCSLCHKELHAKKKIPRLSASGEEIGFMTPCPRCSGLGWLEDYNYYQGGVCFCCGGAKYIELMEDDWQKNNYCGC